MNSNPVLIRDHFQGKVEIVLREAVPQRSLRKIKYYGLCIEFQKRGSPHVYCFTSIFDAPNIHGDIAYIYFVENILHAWK